MSFAAWTIFARARRSFSGSFGDVGLDVDGGEAGGQRA